MESHIEVARFQSFIKSARPHFPPPREKTLFDIGAQGHFENPLSDILSFFLDPKECHGLGTLFLDSMVDCCADSERLRDFSLFTLNTYLTADVTREGYTSDQKRIDILVSTPEWILVIENKVYHAQINPFKSYEEHIVKDYPGRKVLYVILSPLGKSEAEGWIGISFKRYASKLKDRLAATTTLRLFTKWDVIVRELLLHLENFERIRIMDDTQAEFVLNNWDTINQIEKLKSDYFTYLEQIIKEVLVGSYPDQTFQTRKVTWGIYVTSSRWSKTRGELVLTVPGMGTRLHVWCPSLPQQALIARLIPSPLRAWRESANKWFAWETAFYKDEGINSALKGLCELCGILTQVEDE